MDMDPSYKRIVEENFSRASKTYDDHAIAQMRFAQVLKGRLSGEIKSARAILDIGTGTGTLALELAQIFPESRVYGCDISGGMLTVAKKKIESRGLFNFASTRADFESLPYRDSAFDLVVSNAALHWASDLSSAFSEILRVLQPESYLFAAIMIKGTLF